MINFRHLCNTAEDANRSITWEPAPSRVDVADHAPVLLFDAQYRIFPTSQLVQLSTLDQLRLYPSGRNRDRSGAHLDAPSLRSRDQSRKESESSAAPKDLFVENK
jgi:hypothetical protein